MSKLNTRAAISYADPGTGTERVLLLDVPLRELRPGFSQTTYWAQSLDKTATSAITVGSGAYELIGTVRYEDNPQGLLDMVRYGATNTTLTYIPDLADPDQNYSVKLVSPTSLEMLTLTLDRQRAVNGEMEIELRFRQTDQTAFPEVLAGTPVLFKYVAGGSLSDGTFTRADTATYASKGYGTSTSATTGKARIHWRDLDSDSVRETPTLLLEGASTNLITESQNFGATWASSGSPVLTSGQADPAGGTTAYLVADDDGAAQEYIGITPTFTTNAVSKAVSLFLRAGTTLAASGSDIQLRDTTAGADRLLANVTWSNGVPTVTMTTGTSVFTERYRDGWFRFGFRTTAVTVANTNQLRIVPASTAAQTGDIYAWGVQAENALNPSSYIPTAGGTDARTRDALTFPFPARVQTMTVYLRYIQQGTLPWSSSATCFLGIGRVSTTENRLQINNAAGSANCNVSIGGPASATSSSLSISATHGQAVEFVVTITVTPSTKTVSATLRAVFGSTDITSGATTAVQATDGWASDELAVNAVPNNSSVDGYVNVTHCVIMRGVQTLATLRRVVGV